MTIKTLIISLLLSLSMGLFAQGQKSIEEKGINRVQIFETNFEEGEKEKRLIEERAYDAEGNLVEYKEFDEDGAAKEWEKYSYNTKGKLISETSLNKKGELKKRIDHIYVNGLKTEKRYYDAKERLTKTKYYEYKYHQ